MDKDLIIAIILGILIVVGVVQGIELNSLREQISAGDINVQQATTNGQNTASNAPVSDIGMVGGC